MSRQDEPFDTVEKPRHYNVHPSGFEAIEICRHMSFNIGNVIKYCWRAGLKGGTTEDLRKALWYLKDAEKNEEDTAGRAGSWLTWKIVRVVLTSPDDSPLAMCLATFFEPVDGPRMEPRLETFRKWLEAHLATLGETP